MSDAMSGNRFWWMLVLLVAYLFFSPFIPDDSKASMGVHFLLSVTLFFSAWAVQKDHHQRSLALGLMGVALLLYWLGIFKLVPFSSEGALLLFIGFYALLIYTLACQLMRSSRVTGGVIAAALCLYLIIGLLWGASYALLQDFHGGAAFSGTLIEEGGTSQLHIFNYFSMVTLTTLGYGDITPQIPGAAALCQMEAIVGQFFTAVLVARLVGMYRRPDESPPQD
jgi:voltage-gated potassium channel